MAHGSDQLNAHVKAAKSTASVMSLLQMYREIHEITGTQNSADRIEDVLVALAAAKAAERKAYLEYTNPFGAVKTFS